MNNLPVFVTRKIIVEIKPICYGGKDMMGYIVYPEGRPGIWECADKQYTAISKLIRSLEVGYNLQSYDAENKTVTFW